MNRRPVKRGLVVWLLLAAFPFAGCTVRNLIYPVPTVKVGRPPAGFDEVELLSAEGSRALGWHHPGPRSRNRPAMIFFHGNGENLETLKWTGLYDRLMTLGFPVLVVDYPGYGRSTGLPSEKSLKSTAEEALIWMGNRYPDRPIVPCGWSLGAALALHLARVGASQVQGVIAISPWTSLKAVAEIHFPRWLVSMGLGESYDSLGLADQIDIPALVIHGAADRIIPVQQGRRLAAGIDAARWVQVELAGHNDLLGFSAVWQEIDDFMSTLSSPTAL